MLLVATSNSATDQIHHHAPGLIDWHFMILHGVESYWIVLYGTAVFHGLELH